MSLPSAWRPVRGIDLIRLGGKNDGGYMVPRRMIDARTVLLSLGLDDDWAFEKDFLALGGARVVCVDHTVNLRFWVLHLVKSVLRGRLTSVGKPVAYRRFFGASGKAEHRKLKVGYDGIGETSLGRLLASVSSDATVALKVDIEGSEYRILDDILAAQDRLTGLVIEFHDVDLHRDRISAFLEQLRGLQPCWLHANNWGGVDKSGDPIVLEFAFARKADADADADAATLSTDAPNDPNLPDIQLHFAS